MLLISVVEFQVHSPGPERRRRTLMSPVLEGAAKGSREETRAKGQTDMKRDTNETSSVGTSEQRVMDETAVGPADVEGVKVVDAARAVLRECAGCHKRVLEVTCGLVMLRPWRALAVVN